jgi:tetratricopeptide (TPR) repeat protein
MSPEQADSSGLDVDTRTDIYSLGVVLYEMLVGIVPLNLAAIGDQAMRMALREKEPPKPSTRVTELGDTQDEVARARRTDPASLRRELKGDLDWIVMQAIAKDRTQRYETANALATDCQRFLKHEPVMARPPSPGYLLRRFVKRNKLMVTAASIAIAAILAGAGAATLGFIRATEAEQVARREAATANATIDFLIDLFQVSNPYAMTPVTREDATNITAREILDMGAERIFNDLEDQPQVQSGLMTTIGRVYMGLGLLDRAFPLIEDALSIRERVYGAGHIAVGDSLMALGLYHLLEGDYEKAASSQARAIAIYEQAWGTDVPGLAWMLSRQAVTLTNLGRLEEALAMQRRAIDLLRNSPDPDPYAYGNALNNLGFVQNGLTQYEAASKTFAEAVEFLKDTEFHGLYSRALGNLAAAYMQMGRIEDSRALHEEALALRREFFGPEHNETGFSVANLAFLYQYLGDYERAEQFSREAIDIFSKQLGDRHPNIGIILGGLGRTLHLKGDDEQAESTLIEALGILENALGPDNVQISQAHNSLGETYAAEGKYAQAESQFRETLRIMQQLGVEHAHKGRALVGLAKLPESSLSDEQRLNYFRQGLDVIRNTEGLRTPDTAIYQLDFAAYLLQRGDEAQARDEYRDGLRNLAAALPEDNVRYRQQADRYRQLFGEPPP